jgi:uncharacterized protein (DUF2249 family)
MTHVPGTPQLSGPSAEPEGQETAEVILASWTLYAVLRRYPQLLDVLVELCPAFSKLRNPVLRKVQTRLVTVAQAARIGGLEPAALVHALNAAIGAIAPAAAPGEAPEAAPAAAGAPWTSTAMAVALDVRPMLARGEEPFHAIMTAAASVPLGQALRLQAGFEPLPLYDVLAGRGFSHQARQLGPEDWEIVFLRERQRSEASLTASRDTLLGAPLVTPLLTAPESPGPTVRIDVSDLAPPEPMVRILEVLAQLPAGQTLLVEHVRRPVYLYPQLDALGYRHVTRELGPGRVEIRIHKPLTAGDEASR